MSDVTILRLKFETDGVVYNLGVVDNKQTSSVIPDGEGQPARRALVGAFSRGV